MVLPYTVNINDTINKNEPMPRSTDPYKPLK